MISGPSLADAQTCLAYAINDTILAAGLILCLLGNFQNEFFRKDLSGIASECQTVWEQIRPEVLSGLIGSKLFVKVIVGKELIYTCLMFES